MDRKPALEYEMTASPRHSSTIRFVDVEQKMSHPPMARQQNSMFQDFLRHVRLSLPNSLRRRCFGRNYSTERRKTALYQSRRMAALTSLLHFTPLGGATTLLVLFWTKFWIGRDPVILTALQFVAKFHEILMQASLVDILVYFIRSQALEGYIPLGALSGATQASQLSYLWSLDFVSALGSPTFKVWRRIAFGLVVSTMLFMFTAVGPSAAVLMIPRPDMAHVNATESRYMNISEALLYPLYIGEQSDLDMSTMPSVEENLGRSYVEGWTVRTATMKPTTVKLGNVGYNLEDRRTRYSVYTTTLAGDLFETFGIATMPTSLSSLQLFEYNSFELMSTNLVSPENATWTIQSTQPLVNVTCRDPTVWSDDDLYSADMSRKLLDQPRALYEKEILFNQTFKTTERYNDFPPLWAQVPDEPHVLVGLKPERIDEKRTIVVEICTLSAFWRITRTSLTSTNGLTRVETQIPDLSPGMMNENLKAITINPRAMNNSWSTHEHSLQDIFLSSLVEIPTKRSMKVLDGGKILKEEDIPRQDNKSEMTSFRLEVTIYGLGYGMHDTPTLLSVAVITAYCLITLLYIGYIIITGHTSIAWTSPTELIMLALQSKEPSNIGHVSVGIDSTGTLHRNVGIRVSKIDIGDTGEIRERLELVFEDDEGTGKKDLTKVIRNRAY